LALYVVMKFISDFRRQQAGTRIVYMSLPQGPGSSSHRTSPGTASWISCFLKVRMEHCAEAWSTKQWQPLYHKLFLIETRSKHIVTLRERERERMSSICVFLSCSVVAALQKLHWWSNSCLYIKRIWLS
jgi:hypothetical protein